MQLERPHCFFNRIVLTNVEIVSPLKSIDFGWGEIYMDVSEIGQNSDSTIQLIIRKLGDVSILWIEGGPF